MAMLPYSKTKEFKYPALAGEPNAQGMLQVSEDPAHSIHWEEWGNPNGEPLMIVHGGPGGGISRSHARTADPERYRIILFDQRGCGDSVPHAQKDPIGGMADNDTTHSIADMEKLRQHLAIPRMHVYGGSWGSTLGMAYKQAHPERVEGLVLRGIFLCDKDDLSFFYQGNAANYPNDLRTPGAYRAYKSDERYTIPGQYRDERMAEAFDTAWKRYVEVIPPEERGNMIAAYHKRFNDPTLPEAERNEALLAWTEWEEATSYLNAEVGAPSDIGKTESVSALDGKLAFARIENAYFHRALNGGDPAISKLLNPEEVEKMVDSNIRIIQGEFDQVCCPLSARKLNTALRRANAPHVEYTETKAGHALLEAETYAAVTDALDKLPPLKKLWANRNLNGDPHLSGGMSM